MKAAATYFVTPEEGEAYRVVLEAGADGWLATVERDGRRWTFALRRGAEDGRVWIGERLRRWGWSDGGLSLDGVEHPLLVETAARRRARDIRAAGSTGPQASEVRAPMPGLVVAVEVEEGAR
ncbi:MAG: hypothetical protein ACREK5_07205, partial [Gemmatimonadota bacterium]